MHISAASRFRGKFFPCILTLPVTSRHRLRFRQVHLDFHTHGDIPGIGKKFSKRRFEEALAAGRQAPRRRQRAPQRGSNRLCDRSRGETARPLRLRPRFSYRDRAHACRPRALGHRHPRRRLRGEPSAKTRVLIERRVSYFNRTWEHFCSHQHAPDSPAKASPAATLTVNIAWFAHDIFTRYRQYGQPLYRDFVAAAIDRLLEGKRPAVTTLPADGRFNRLEQPGEKRFVAHLLYAPKSVRGAAHSEGVNKSLEIIEGLIPLRDTGVSVRLPRKIKSARIVPGGEPLPFTPKDGLVAFTVPEFTGHAMIELDYA